MQGTQFQTIVFLVVRAGFFLLMLATSLYCVLAAVPFTYYWVIACPIVPSIPLFLKLHTYLFWLFAAGIVATLPPHLNHPKTKWLKISFFVLVTVTGIFLTFHPLSSLVRFDGRSFVWGLLSLSPLFWLSAIDLLENCYKFEGQQQHCIHNRLSFSTAILSGVSLSLLYYAVFYLRYVESGGAGFTNFDLSVILGLTLACHVFLFVLLSSFLNLIHYLASKTSRPFACEFFLSNVVIYTCIVLFFNNVLFPTISLGAHQAIICSAVMAAAIAASVASINARLYRHGEDRQVASGLDLALLMFTPPRKASWRTSLLMAIAIICAAYAFPVFIFTADWNSVLQKLTAALIWIAVFGFFYRLRPTSGTSTERSQKILMTVVLLAAISYGVLNSYRLPGVNLKSEATVNSLLERYSAYDASFCVAFDILTFLHRDKGDPAFYDFLRQNSNVSSSIETGPLQVNLVNQLVRSDGEKPNIFVFVVDSLRQDYLSPYNKGVNFTPSIEQFSRESEVMVNAFTRYGGTSLAEPSIWTGSMLLHRQYAEPFYPLNSLQRLVDVEGYQQYIMIDPILKKILRPSALIKELDRRANWYECDFCNSLAELQSAVEQNQKHAGPMFAYTQPQNVHTVSLTVNPQPVSSETFHGFNKKYAAQVQRIDECFGKFIASLKRNGLYENSIIVLTADHGESLGDEGHWGHAPTLFPEVVRIPLIVHLPVKLKSNLQWDSEAVAFSTDLTPSLYYLLGHRPTTQNPIHGRPLFTETLKEQEKYKRDSYLLAASYGAVYGILADNGHTLFIADAINQKEYFYKLESAGNSMPERPLDGVRQKHRQQIQEQIYLLNNYFNVRSSTGYVDHPPMR